MLWWLAQNALVAGLLAGLVALVCRLGRFGPAVRHALWLVVLIKLATPPLIVWPWALPGIGEVPASARGAAADAATPSEEWLPLVMEVETILASADPSPAEEPSLPPLRAADGAIEPSTTNQAAWGAWLAPLVYNLWLAGTAVMCLLQIFRIARFRRLLARTDPAPGWLEKLVAKLAGTLRVRRPLTVIVPGISSPFVWSLGRPKLLWPTSLLERLPHHCQRSIVAHELAHLRRRDHWIGWLQLVAECVWWWNPLFWYVRWQLRLNAELACDAWVVSTLPEDRRAYAEALIEVTELISQTAAPMPALGMSSAARQDFERRLTMIMRDRVPCRVPLVGLLAIGVLALVSLPGWSQAEVKVQAVSDVQEVPAPEKPIILKVPGDLDYEDAKRVIRAVQKIAGDTRVVEVGVEAQPGSSPDRDRRLQQLEEQLRELLKEVQALRAGSPKPQTILKMERFAKPGEPSDRPHIQIIERKRFDERHESAPGAPEVAKAAPKGTLHIDRDVTFEHMPGVVQYLRDGKVIRAVALTRATYKLPHAKAEALANLLSQHGKGEVLETKVDGDSLIITTTPEAQKAITQFMSLIQGATTATTIDAKKPKTPELKPGDAGAEKRFFFKLEPGEEFKNPLAGEKKDH